MTRTVIVVTGTALIVGMWTCGILSHHLALMLVALGLAVPVVAAVMVL